MSDVLAFMPKLKVIFLDIDGVLNGANFGEDLYYEHFHGTDVPIDKQPLDNLKALLDEVPDAKIVWSTDWRLCDEPAWNSWTNPRLWLEQQDFMKGRILGATSQKTFPEHCHEICQWLLEHQDEVRSYVILEDSCLSSDWSRLEKHLV